MEVEGRNAFLFLNVNKLFISDGSNIEELDFPANLIKDLDVADKALFDGTLDTFIKAKKLVRANLWIILSDTVSFAHEIKDKDPVRMQEEAKEFIDSVPFDQIISKEYKSTGGIRVIAANLGLIETIEEVFERNGFNLAGIVPSAVFKGFEGITSLAPDFAKFILANEKLLTSANMLQRVGTTITAASPQNRQQNKNKLLPYLIVGLALLLFILILVLIMRR